MTSFFLFPLIRNYVYNKLLCTALNHVIQMSCLARVLATYLIFRLTGWKIVDKMEF